MKLLNVDFNHENLGGGQGESDAGVNSDRTSMCADSEAPILEYQSRYSEIVHAFGQLFWGDGTTARRSDEIIRYRRKHDSIGYEEVLTAAHYITRALEQMIKNPVSLTTTFQPF